jgi:acyl carrier protein
MTDARAALEARVIAIVAETLDRQPSDVRADASLIDDLGAESIDFLDLVFRLESGFGITIPEQDIWRGSIRAEPGAGLEEDLAALRARTPGFRWDRFPGPIGKDDLPRLITIRTIVDYLASRGLGAADAAS